MAFFMVPVHLVPDIAQWLGADDLQQFCTVCRRVRQFCNTPRQWKQLCEHTHHVWRGYTGETLLDWKKNYGAIAQLPVDLRRSACCISLNVVVFVSR